MLSRKINISNIKDRKLYRGNIDCKMSSICSVFMAKHVFGGAFIQWYTHKGIQEEGRRRMGMRVLPFWDPKVAPTFEQLALLSLKGLSIWVADDRVGSLNATRLTETIIRDHKWASTLNSPHYWSPFIWLLREDLLVSILDPWVLWWLVTHGWSHLAILDVIMTFDDAQNCWLQ